MHTQEQLEALSLKIFEIRSEEDFHSLALALFRLHYTQNPVYRQYVQAFDSSFDANAVQTLRQIPFLPVEVFKTRKVFLEGVTEEDYFLSSGTGSQGAVHSTHHVGSLAHYRRCFTRAFEHFFGDVRHYAFFALTPEPASQPHSSLIYMLKGLMEESGRKENGFYLGRFEELAEKLQMCLAQADAQAVKPVLFGLSYALWDFAEKHPMDLSQALIFETGGMKGKRQELPKEEFHAILKKAFHVSSVLSEYGMCELTSQAYITREEYRFSCPPWMRVMIRKTNDPLQYENFDRVGGINLIDLGNLYSCPFIATQDLGIQHPDLSFEVKGRFAHSDLRGCNLMLGE